MGLLNNKKILITGLANKYSIASGIAQAMHREGAELAFMYQNERLLKKLEPIAESLGSNILLECDVSSDDDIKNLFPLLEKEWGKFDVLVHSIAFVPREALSGDFIESTTRENFTIAHNISSFSFTALAKEAVPYLNKNASLLTLSYLGAERTMPNYNVMGVAKAALEASVRYLAVDLGGENIRVNGLSAGPMRTLAGAAIGGARHIFRHSEENAPLRRNPGLEEVGRSGLYLISDLSSGVTGEVHFVDGGFNAVAIPREHG